MRTLNHTELSKDLTATRVVSCHQSLFWISSETTAWPTTSRRLTVTIWSSSLTQTLMATCTIQTSCRSYFHVPTVVWELKPRSVPTWCVAGTITLHSTLRKNLLNSFWWRSKCTETLKSWNKSLRLWKVSHKIWPSQKLTIAVWITSCKSPLKGSLTLRKRRLQIKTTMP